MTVKSAQATSELKLVNHRLEVENERLRNELFVTNETLRGLAEVEDELLVERQRRFDLRYALKTTTVQRPTTDQRELEAALWLENGLAAFEERLKAYNKSVVPGEAAQALNLDVGKTLEIACELVSSGMRRGLYVVNSAFEFKPEYNQRPIALAKEAAALGYFVIFVAWQWDTEERLQHRGRIFSGSILEIGRFDLQNLLDRIDAEHIAEPGVLVLTIPSRDFVDALPRFQSLGFATIYDIMDDWEGFHGVGQASWWTQELEERALQAVDKVTVVSPVLREKFAHRRTDIRVIANGLRVVSADEKFISSHEENDRCCIIVGYFGHLTDSWFDWEGVLALAASSDALDIQIIGYGEPEWVKARVKDVGNITLVGFVPADKLASHVANWHIGIIPFKATVLVKAVDPIKIYEYLHFGLPVIATGMPHLATYPETQVLESISGANGLCKQLYARIKSGEIDYESMASFTRDSTWRRRLETILA